MDTTIRYSFLFTVRCRDDAQVADPTPAFVSFPVIDPKHERDVLVMDYTNRNNPYYSFPIDYDYSDTLPICGLRKATFYNLITNWNPAIDFDTVGFYGDYGQGSLHQSDATALKLDKTLKYKVIILYSDWLKSNSMTATSTDAIFTAIDAGVNAWATGRCLVKAESSGMLAPSFNIQYYFGVEEVFFSDWMSFLMGTNDFNGKQRVRIEDFVGAISIDETMWPSIDIDTARLHSRYGLWLEEAVSPVLPACPWIDTIAALPEVNWCSRQYGTEVMYLYKSRFDGPNHFLGYPYTIHGAPVGHRLNSGMFRTAWWMFPPLPMDSVSLQEATNVLLDWLYDPTLGPETVVEKRYPDAAVEITVDEAQQVFIDRRSQR